MAKQKQRRDYPKSYANGGIVGNALTQAESYLANPTGYTDPNAYNRAMAGQSGKRSFNAQRDTPNINYVGVQPV